MDWGAVRAGYIRVLLLIVPFFLAMVWVIETEKQWLAITFVCSWLIFGNIAFFRAYKKKKSNVSRKSKN